MNGEAMVEINEGEGAATADQATADLAAEIKTLNERRQREAADAAALAQAKKITAARAAVVAAAAAVPLTEKPLKDAEREYQKYQAKINKADNSRAEIEQGIKILKTPEKRDRRLAELNAEMASAAELRDHYNRKYIEAGQAAADAGGRVTKARTALTAAEAVLEGGHSGG